MATDLDNPGIRYEPTDASPRLVGWIGGGIAASVLALCLLIGFLFPFSIRDRPKPTLAEPPPPRLETDPYADLLQLRAAAEQRLASYGWVDRDNGIVHVPIDRAMALTAERGIPGWAGDRP